MKKNIIFITTDEQHFKTISAYGATTHKTPAIDKIIKEGCDYVNAYTASPVCLPSRCTWMTGMYPHQNGSISNIYGASLSHEYPNLFTELKKEGYTTSLHGKCHFVPVPYPATKSDETLEYEHFITYYKSLGMDTLNLQDDKNNSLWYYDHYSKYLEKNGKLRAYKYAAHIKEGTKGIIDFPLEDELHPDYWVGKKAVEHIKRDSCVQPNFIWVSFSGPHYPIDTPNSYLKQVDMTKDIGRVHKQNEWEDDTKYHYNGYNGPGTTEGSAHVPYGAQKYYTEEYWTEWRKKYFGNVVLIDEMIDKIMTAASEKWGENYLIIFTADHGEMMGNHSLWGKNGSVYEDVVHVPLAIYDAETPSFSTKTEMISSVDIFPTILTYAQCPIPSSCTDGNPIDEIVNKGGRDHVISMKENSICIIKNNKKLVLNCYEKNAQKKMYREMYDLDLDIHEFSNVYNSSKYEDVKKELIEILEEYERKEFLLSTTFHEKEEKTYWLNTGNGAGFNGGNIPLTIKNNVF